MALLPFQPSKLHKITFFSSTTSSIKQLCHFYELLDPFASNLKMQNHHFQHPSQYSFQPTEIHHGRKVLPHGPDFMVSTSGRAIPVATANQTVIPSKGSLFVGDISFFCTEADMVRLFEPYGRVLHVEVRRNAAGESLRHGFAELASVDAAQRAINDLHSSKFMGRRIRVHWACVHVDKRQPRDRTNWTQIYVSFCALRRERIVTEALLDDIFSHFGPVADVTVKKHSLVAPAAMSSSPMSYFSSSSSSPTASLSSLHSSAATPVWTGYAFVYFYDRQDAERATQALRTFESEDLRLACSLSLRASLSGEAAASQHGYPALRPQIPIAQPPRLHDDMVARPVRLALQPPPQPFGLSFQADYGFFQSKLGPQADTHPLGETYESRGLEISPPASMQPPMHFGAPGHSALW